MALPDNKAQGKNSLESTLERLKTWITEDSDIVAASSLQLSLDRSYIKFTNGLIVQWGYEQFSGGRTTITLPISLTDFNTGSSFVTRRNADDATMYVSAALGENGATLDLGASTTANDYFDWFVIGY